MSTLLHLVPIVTSTVSLWYAFDQFFFLGLFLNKKVEPSAKQVITPYWNTFLGPGIPLVIAPLFVTIGSAGAIIATNEELLRDKGSYPWYIATVALAAGHFAFVPAVMPKINGLKAGGSTPVLRQWMVVHLSRLLTVDVFCWVSCLVASVKTLGV